MNNKLIIAFIGGLIVFGVLAFFLFSGSKNEEPLEVVDTTAEEVNRGVTQEIAIEDKSEEMKSFSIQDIESHDQESDCWLVIEGKVYEVTSWIPTHPGGKAILEGCGTDATELFKTRPMGSGTEHSSRAKGLLDSYYIGDLE
jgi:cytochrome b involved in lipid metabolism